MHASYKPDMNPPETQSAPLLPDAATRPEVLAQQLQERDQELQAALTQLKKVKAELAKAQRQISELHNSTSWRLTAVFRGPLMRLMNIKRSLTLVRTELASRGGLTTLLGDLYADIRSDGWSYFTRLYHVLRSNGHVNPAPGSRGHDRNDYMQWMRMSQRMPLAPSQPAQRTAQRPLISVLIPIYKPPLDLLKLAIQSVREQPFEAWELCIADDASADASVKTYLDGLQASDPRVHVVYREKNGHISACTNSALELARGDFVLLLDQDDVLSSHALAAVARAIQAHPDAAIIYSDEDRMSEDATQHFGVYFKPDFNYDLLLGQNMISHLGVYARSELVAIGGFRLGLEGSQDYDLALRVMERVRPEQIVHIPHVLYHWRAIKGSTALDHSEKSYASTASLTAVRDHLERTAQRANVSSAPDVAFFNRVRYELQPARPRVLVVVSVQESIADLLTMAHLLAKQAGQVHCEFVFCAPPDKASFLLQHLDSHEVEKLHLSVFEIVPGESQPRYLNRLLASCDSDFVCLVNLLFSSASEAWLEELVRVAGQQRVGFVAPRVRDSLRMLDHGGVLLPEPMRATYVHKGLQQGDHGQAGRASLQQRFGALSHALLVFRRAHLAADAFFNQDFGDALYVLDKCLELNHAGLANIWLPYSELGYTKSVYAGRVNLLADQRITSAERERWTAKWSTRYVERCYNPNLSRRGDFSLEWKRPAALIS